MGISWGRRPLRDRGPVVRARALFAASAVAAALLASAGPPSLGRAPSIVDADTRQRIQETLDQHVEAIAKRDAFVYQRTLDRRDPLFDRCMRELFDLGDLRVQALRPARVVGLSQVAPSLVRLQVEQRHGVATAYMRRLAVVSFLALQPFNIRRVFFVWYVSPPGPDEVGAERTQTTDEVSLTYWEVDKGLAEPLLGEVVRARDLALVSAPRPASRSLRVRLAPDREYAAASVSCLTTARYDPSADELVLYGYWHDGAGEPSGPMRAVLRDEVRHLLQQRAEARSGGGARTEGGLGLGAGRSLQ